jgi:transcriptional regulator with XRE-family HTH domain
MTRKKINMRPAASDAVKVLGQQIKQARFDRDWSVVDAAARAGISPVTFTSIEAGTGTTSIGTVFHVAALLGVPLFTSTDPNEIARMRYSGERDMGLLKSRAGGVLKRSRGKVASDGYPA